MQSLPSVSSILIFLIFSYSAGSHISLCLGARSYPTLCDPMDCSPPGSSVHGDSPGKNTAVGCHALLQGIFPTQGASPGLTHCRWILYHLSHQGSPYFSADPIFKQTRSRGKKQILCSCDIILEDLILLRPGICVLSTSIHHKPRQC